jgi:hypothetical protein
MKRRFGPLVALGSAVLLLASVLVHAQAPKAQNAAKRAQQPVIQTKTPIVVNGRVVGAANQVDLVAQLAERSRPYLCVEYHFLRTVCGLSEDERKTIAREAEQAFKDAIAKYDEMRRSAPLRLPGVAPQVLPYPRKLIQECLLRVAEKHLSPERAARYREEVALRNLDRTRATIKRLIDWLDHELILSSEQRTALASALFSTWDEDWVRTEAMVLYPERYISGISRQRIVRVLDEEQRKLWDQLVRSTAAMPVYAATTTLLSDFPEDEELTAARTAGVSEKEASP